MFKTLKSCYVPLIFLCAIILGGGIFFSKILKIFQENIFFNAVIVSVALVGVILVWTEYIRVLREETHIRQHDAKRPRVFPRESLMLSFPFLQWCQSGAAGDPKFCLQQCLQRMHDRKRVISYLSHVLVFLGLLGTLWGLSQTVILIAQMIGHMPTSGASEDFLTTLKGQLSAPLSGMGLAFSTSLFGLTGSVILNFFLLYLSKMHGHFYDRLSTWGQEIMRSRSTLYPSEESEGSAIDPQQITNLLGKVAQTIDQLSQSTSLQAERCQDLMEAFLSFSGRIQDLSDLMRAQHGILHRWAQEQMQSRYSLEQVGQKLQELAFSGDEAIRMHLAQIAIAAQFLAKKSGLNEPS